MTGFNSTLSRSLGPSVIGVAGREMEDLFDRLFATNGNGHTARKWVPPISVREEGEHYHLEMDLPGFAGNDIDMTFEESRLKISAKRTRDNTDDRKYLHDERSWGEITRLISVPDSVDPESIQASYEGGVLHVQLAKRPEVMPKKIEIKTK